MKAASAALLNLLHGSRAAAMAECYTITPANLAPLRWTTAPAGLVYGGQTFTPTGGTVPRITRGAIREAGGLEVATLKVTMACTPSVLLGGRAMARAALDGVLDGAGFRLDRVFMATPGGAVVGGLLRFGGLISRVEPSPSAVVLEVKSALESLNEQLPRHFLRPLCSHALFDVGCGLSRASYQRAAQVSTYWVLTPGPTIFGTTLNYNAADPSLVNGLLTFTSGALAGLARRIREVSTIGQGMPQQIQVTVNDPFPSAPANGDALTVVPGCDKSIATCRDKFMNLPRRRGFDFVPAPEMVSR